MDVVDILLIGNRLIESALFAMAKSLEAKSDNRWFFAYAHASITKRINRGIRLFHKPEELLLFNMMFAGKFLDALSKKNPKDVPAHWKDAFDFCGGWGILKRAGQISRLSPERAANGSVEDLAAMSPMLGCGQKMASAHINVDIKDALKEMKCQVSAVDFGNMLYFVEEGADDALEKAYGETGGLVATTAKTLARKVEKEWRNAVYKSVCGQEVPEPEADFKLKSWKMEHEQPLESMPAR